MIGEWTSTGRSRDKFHLRVSAKGRSRRKLYSEESARDEDVAAWDKGKEDQDGI